MKLEKVKYKCGLLIFGSNMDEVIEIVYKERNMIIALNPVSWNGEIISNIKRSILQNQWRIWFCIELRLGI